ncbi:hypothetical protein OIE62_35695 [Streptomyces scopuliridis]|uniref:Uncharacterized protein n=1 Tax=Streptomyces scopuliridis TaxID=452529 RepID=A0ACD4ZDD7_9ACTN|nr:DUF6630 family protein [Streptomyces scopuliridis]WSB32198.1 hypothetical protein OG949_04535 [Streptomyces scopuliridis]WSB96459.1 hypothetical protein OG835_05235 [Streptomyces scopuliridis]WSC09837.1 hypothetical protein OIE62_35695 [Streptomyces scopuliridis]
MTDRPASASDPAAQALTALAELLAPGRAAVAEEVLFAYEDPDAYVRTHATRLEDRGIDAPIENLAWIALVDALTAQGLLAEVDWKEDGDEIRRQLRALESRPAVDPWSFADREDADGTDPVALDTAAFLNDAGRLHLDLGVALAVLDIESDCYPLVCFPARRASELTPLAARAGFYAAVLGSDQL